MASFTLAFITDELCQDFGRAVATAVELGYQAVEVRSIWDKNIVDLDSAQVARLRQIADLAGIRILSVASPVFKCTHPEGGAIDHRFEQDAFHSAHQFSDQPRILDRSIEIAGELGASIVRVFSFWRTMEPQRLFGQIVASLAGAIDKAGRHGITIGLENEHACNIGTGAETAKVLAALDHPNLKVVWDPCNALVAGESAFPEGYRMLPPGRIVHVHAKDCFVRDHTPTFGPLGECGIDWKGQIAALVADGYRGWISLETHWPGPGGNKHEASMICGRNLKTLVTRS